MLEHGGAGNLGMLAGKMRLQWVESKRTLCISGYGDMRLFGLGMDQHRLVALLLSLETKWWNVIVIAVSESTRCGVVMLSLAVRKQLLVFVAGIHLLVCC